VCGSYFSEARIGGQTRDGIEKVEICVILTLMPETGIAGIKNKVRTHHIVALEGTSSSCKYPSCELRPHSHQIYLLVPSPQSLHYQKIVPITINLPPQLFPWLGHEAQIVRVDTSSLDMQIMSPPLASVLEFQRMR